MAIEGKRRSSAGTAGGRRSTRETRRDVIDVYVDGSNALVMDAMPAGIPAREEDSRPKLSEQTRANRERSMQMNVGNDLRELSAAAGRIYGPAETGDRT